MKKFIVLIILVSVSYNSYCQKKVSLEILTGVGFNKKKSLANEEIENYTSFTTQINAVYQFKLSKNFSIRTGVGVQSYFSSGDIGISDFRVTSLILNVPFAIHYFINKKTTIGAGYEISNNKDFNDIDFRTNENIRGALLIKSSYTVNECLDFLFLFRHKTSKVSNTYLINQPKMDLSIGACFKIF